MLRFTLENPHIDFRESMWWFPVCGAAVPLCGRAPHVLGPRTFRPLAHVEFDAVTLPQILEAFTLHGAPVEEIFLPLVVFDESEPFVRPYRLNLSRHRAPSVLAINVEASASALLLERSSDLRLGLSLVDDFPIAVPKSTDEHLGGSEQAGRAIQWVDLDNHSVIFVVVAERGLAITL